MLISAYILIVTICFFFLFKKFKDLQLESRISVNQKKSEQIIKVQDDLSIPDKIKERIETNNIVLQKSTFLKDAERSTNIKDSNMYDNNHQEMKNEEKRYLPRWQVRNRVFYKLDNFATPNEAITRDISCSGVSILIDKSIFPKQDIELTIFLEKDLAIRVDGHVAWIKTIGDKNVLGIKFARISQEAQNIVLEHAFELGSKDVETNPWFKDWKNKEFNPFVSSENTDLKENSE